MDGYEKSADSLYRVEDFVKAGSQIFGRAIRQECIVAAFRLADSNEATIEEAKNIVQEFCEKEVI